MFRRSVYVFYVDLRMINDYFPAERYSICFDTRDEVCVLRGYEMNI
jgi:hypothetical protein